MIKKTVRYSFRFIIGILCFLLFYGALAFILPFLKTKYSVVQPKEGIVIYIQSNGVHTDFVMPVRSKLIDWNKLMPYSDFERVDDTFEYVAVGWGDKGFFIGTPTWADLKFSTAFNAAFGLSSTAMHVTYKRNTPQLNESCIQMRISEQEYATLIAYIVTSFQIKDKHFTRIDHPGYSDRDCFYEANGTYSLFKTCNVWTGMGVQAMGRGVGVWTPLANGVLESVK